MITGHGVRDRLADEGDPDETLLRVLHGLLDRERDLLRLAEAVADDARAVADHHALPHARHQLVDGHDVPAACE